MWEVIIKVFWSCRISRCEQGGETFGERALIDFVMAGVGIVDV